MAAGDVVCLMMLAKIMKELCESVTRREIMSCAGGGEAVARVMSPALSARRNRHRVSAADELIDKKCGVAREASAAERYDVFYLHRGGQRSASRGAEKLRWQHRRK